MPQSVTMHPSLDSSALTQAQSANQSEQQQMAAIQPQGQVHSMMMMPGLMPCSVPNHVPSYQAALQNPQGRQLQPLGQQPSTAQVALMQQTPPHLTSLQDSSLVGETFCPFPTGPAVGSDGGAVDPPTQGAVHSPFLRPLLWPHPSAQTSQLWPHPSAQTSQLWPHPSAQTSQLWPKPSAQTSQLLTGELSICIQHLFNAVQYCLVYSQTLPCVTPHSPLASMSSQ